MGDSSSLAAKLASALVLSSFLCLLFAGDVRLQQGQLRLGDRGFLIHGVGYAPLPLGSQPADPVPSCVYARDLPLVAAMGANVIRTYALLPEGDTAFTALLETTGLYWLAGFPLDPYYDPARPITARRDEILQAFRDYAVRFHDEPRLIGFVLGEEVAGNYASRFAGSVSDFYSLLADAAQLLQDLEPDKTPLLATSTSDPAELANTPPGLSFWLWNAGPRRTLSAAINDILRLSSRPVLVADYGVDAFNQTTGSEDEQTQAQAAADLTREIESSGLLLGGVYAAFADDYRSPRHSGIFRLSATERPGIDHVLPRAVFSSLAGLWQGRVPADWRLEQAPGMTKFVHAASGADTVAPGALVRVTGTALDQGYFVANGIPWPLHLGETCLCVGGAPVPLDMISPEAATAQIPWDLPPGDQPAVLFRAGVATNIVTADVRRYAPGIFPGGVVRAGTYCRVTEQNGVRPGEILEVYASGVGPGAPSWETPAALINGVPAEVLYSGTLPNLVGLNQVNLRVSPLTPPAANSTLQLSVDDASGSPYSLSVAGPEDRLGISLLAPSSEVVVQAGGPGKLVEIQVEGRNGYCGPILLAAAESPSGVTFRAPVGNTGETVPLELRAAASAPPLTGATMVLYGYAPGATSGTASLHVTVLAGLGDIRVRVISGGYKAQPLARFDWNDRVLFSTTGAGMGRGINVMAVDAATGVFSPVQSFDTWGDDSASSRLVEYLVGLPAGAVVLAAVADDGSLRLSSQARDAIAAMFGSRSIQKLAYQQSWAMIARKGASSPIAEAASTVFQVALDRTLAFPQP